MLGAGCWVPLLTSHFSFPTSHFPPLTSHFSLLTSHLSLPPSPLPVIYFASDLHLGVDARLPSAERERLFVKWLEEVVAVDGDALYLMGDVFEFWFEYRHVVPRGYVRLLGKLAQLRDAGLEIHYFTGNHDLWMRDYFRVELGIPLHHRPEQREFDGAKFLIGHGDGLGPGDKGYKRMKKVFRNPLAQWTYARLHPNFAIALARRIADVSRSHTGTREDQYFGADKEWLVQYCERKLAQFPQIEYFIFGHRHLPIDLTLSNHRSRYLNLGDWLKYQSYAKWDGQRLSLQFFEAERVVFP